MFSFFKKNKSTPADFSFLRADMHSHLIPGIDDGAKTMEASIQLVRRLVDLGYQKIITTPHIMGEYYPNTPEAIQQGLTALQEALQERGIAVEIAAAAEYFVDDFFEKLLLSKQPLLTFSDHRLLIEFSTHSAPTNLHDIIFQLNTHGYRPILAHPERYLYYSHSLEALQKIKTLGCSLQVNLLSLTGYYGGAQKKLGLQLLQAGLVDFLGTDLHRESQVTYLQTIFKDRKVGQLLQEMTFQNAQL